MKILHIISSVNPRGGGPMEGLRQRGLRLIEMGHQVEVVTLDDPANDFVVSYGLNVIALGPTMGGYQFNPKLVPWLQLNASDYDAVIVNGLWQYHSFAAWRALSKMKIPYFVFTHGMLDPWFKHTYPLKHLKKWLYWPWAEYRVLRDARVVFFTCEEERILARQSFWLYKVREQVVTYGTKTPPSDGVALAETFYTQFPALREKRVFLFLSRIQEKKGCDLTIEAFAEFAVRDINLHLVIAGPSQQKYQEKLQALAQRLEIADRITWTGMLQGDMKWGAFYASEAYVLSSHQENFGIAVAEGLGCGVPVLISDKVNIWREIEADGAGIVNPDTLAGTKESFRHWLALDETARQQMRANAKRCFEERFTVESMANSFVAAIQKWRKYNEGV
jgi:glycosyltransferase involved in cell wall biosynthesis